MGVGFGILDNRGYYLALFLLFLACSSPAGLPVSEDQSNVDTAGLISKIESFESPRFSIQKVIPEDGAIRVNIVFSHQPENQTELKRATLNALFEIQTSAGKTTRLSVWSWDPTSKNFSGYAFYSHVANSYHFKVSGGLE